MNPMKKAKSTSIILCCSLLLSLPLVAHAFQKAEVSHDLELLLLPEEERLEATDSVTLSSPDGNGDTFTLSPRATIGSVTINGEDVHFTFSKGRLRIEHPPHLAPGPFTIKIAYTATFPPPARGEALHDEDPTYGIAATISKEGIFLGAGWYPKTEKGSAYFKVTVETPPGIEAVTSGRRLQWHRGANRTLSIWKTDTPLSSLALSAGPFVVVESMAGDIPVYTYFREQSQDLASVYHAKTAQYLSLYQQMFGPYPFEKFAVVENFVPTGYGFPSWTLIGSGVIRLPFIPDTSLGHEIAHSWWGNGVLVDYRAGNWSEGLTTYVADYLYSERKSAAAGREYRLKILRDYAALVDEQNAYAVAAFGSRKSGADRATGYGKVAMIFHMLRQQLGDEHFQQGLRRLTAERMLKKTSWLDIERTFADVSRRDLSSFFSQWLHRKRGPALSFDAVRMEQQVDGWSVSGVLRQEATPYDLKVPLRLETEGETLDTIIDSADRETPFSLFSRVRPDRLLLDPDVSLFRRLHPDEIPPSINDLKGAGKLLVVAAQSLPKSVIAEASKILPALRRAKKVVSEEQVTPEMLKGRDVLFLGWPTATLAPDLPDGLEVSAGGFSVHGSRYGGGNDALFAVWRSAGQGNRTSALYLPLSEKAATASFRKIPHYGKYGLLVFSNGKNRMKRIGPAEKGPTVVTFQPQP